MNCRIDHDPPARQTRSFIVAGIPLVQPADAESVFDVGQSSRPMARTESRPMMSPVSGSRIGMPGSKDVEFASNGQIAIVAAVENHAAVVAHAAIRGSHRREPITCVIRLTARSMT